MKLSLFTCLAVLGTVLVANTNAANLEETNAPLKPTIVLPNPLMANNPNVLNAHAMIPPQDELETIAFARQFGYGRPYGYGGGLGGYGGLYGPGFGGGYGGGLGYGGGMGYGGYGRPYGGYGYGGRPYGFGK